MPIYRISSFNTDKLKFLKIYCESGIQKRDLCNMNTQYFVKVIYFEAFQVCRIFQLNCKQTSYFQGQFEIYRMKILKNAYWILNTNSCYVVCSVPRLVSLFFEH